MVPSLAFDRGESCQFFKLIWRRVDERQFALFRHDQQHVLVWQEQQLAVAIAATLPLAPAILEVDARQQAPVEAEGVALVNDKIVEIRLQPNGGPALFHRPSSGSVLE